MPISPRADSTVADDVLDTASPIEAHAATPEGRPRRARRWVGDVVRGSGLSCRVRLPDGTAHHFGGEPPMFTLKFHSNRVLDRCLDELSFANAYVQGQIDIEGDMAAMLRLRTRVKDEVRVSAWLRFVASLCLRSETGVNRRAIKAHYQFGDELYLSFIDQRYRFYSQGIFRRPDEALEDASEHKLEQMFEALRLKPGMRLLDIGGGWGGVPQYCGARGVKVTSLTLGEDSHRFIGDLIRREGLPCEVLLQDFLTYEPEEPFDAIVIYGVIEHIVNYRRFSDQVWRCLKPQGRLFLDASASIVKYDVSGFSRKYIWSGTHTFLCLQDLLGELLRHGMQVLRVQNESEHYARTMLHWARRLEQSQEAIVRRWGEPLYRAFRLYLWGGSQAFPHLLQAYHLVAERMDERPPVAGPWRRWLAFIGRQGGAT